MRSYGMFGDAINNFSLEPLASLSQSLSLSLLPLPRKYMFARTEVPLVARLNSSFHLDNPRRDILQKDLVDDLSLTE